MDKTTSAARSGGGSEEIHIPGNSKIRLAYLVGQYPAITHTFILREVARLREMGCEIQTASINQPEWSQDGIADAEQDEAARTFYIKVRGLARVLRDHVSCLTCRPCRYISGLMLALQLGGWDLRAVFHHFFYFAEAVVVGNWMKRNALQHLHVHFAVATSTVALITHRVFGVPYSITVHGPDEFYGTKLHHLSRKIESASFIVCISQFCRSQLMAVSPPHHWSKLEVCPLGVDPEVFQPKHRVTEALQIVCVGRLTPRKGQAILLASIAKLLQRGATVHLNLVGDGPDRKMLGSMASQLNIQGAVTFHGSVNQAQVGKILEHADIFVLPSFAEGVPVSLMEAMSMEIPCVSTYIAGIPELIVSGDNGILVPASDSELLAQALERVIVDPELRLRLGRQGRRKILDSYNLRVNVERLASIFGRRLS